MYWYQIDPSSVSYEDFILNSPYWAEVIQRYQTSTLPKYCDICFSFKNIQLHHEDYSVLGHELTGNNLHHFVLQKKLVPVCGDCHYKLTFDETGEKIPQTFEFLRQRRQQLRAEYVKDQLRPTRFLPFLGQMVYRFFW